MKEEEYRDYLETGWLTIGRYKICCIADWNKRYCANPGGSNFESKGQLVFAMSCCTTSTCMGQCLSGTALIPAGINCINSSAYGVTGVTGLCTCGFCTGTWTYVALGSSCICGATLWRRIN